MTCVAALRLSRIFAAVSILCLCLGATDAGAEPEALAATPAAGRVGLPSELRPVSEVAPRLAESEHARRRWLLALDGALLATPCPSWASACGAQGGVAARLSVWSRPTPSFSFGGVLLHSSRSQGFTHQAVSQRLDSDATAGLLGGRVWLASTGVFDPYLEAATGLGQLRRVGRLRSGDESFSLRDRRLVPVYSASFGADWHLSEHLRLGGFLGFRHWLVHPAERCVEAFGVCSLPTPSFFSLDAGAWNAGLSVSISWGLPH